METGSADFAIFKTELFSRLDNSATGTLFVATGDNHAAQVVLFKGQLLGVAYCGRVNAAALTELSRLPGMRFSFTPELIYPLTETLLPAESRQLLMAMGYEPCETSPAADEAPVIEAAPEPAAKAPRRGTLRVYRGRVISGQL